MALRRWKVTLHLGASKARPQKITLRKFYVRASSREQAEEFAKMALRMLERREVTLDDVVLAVLLRERGKDEESE